MENKHWKVIIYYKYNLREHSRLLKLQQKSVSDMLSECKETRLLKRNLERLSLKIDKFNNEMKQQAGVNLPM